MNKKNEETDSRYSKRILILIGSAILLAYMITTYVIGINQIAGVSMQPTLKEHDWVLTSKLAYQLGHPEAGDVIIFEKATISTDLMVKRIIGVPMDKIEIRDGILYRNETAIDEQLLDIAVMENMSPVIVPEHQYFVVGDHRQQSNDSRYWKEPFVAQKDIVGKVILKCYPGIEKME